ncbi:MAG: fibronectin type III domain-containing protein [Planctomycetota bacterium]
MSWDPCIGADTYSLREFSDAGFGQSVLVYEDTGTSFTVSGKTSGVFYYMVRANNSAGSSGWTYSANGCIIVPPDPPATLDVPPTTRTGNYTISWASSEGAVRYELEEDISPSFNDPQSIYDGPDTSFDVTGKTSGVYYYRVRGINGAGAGSWRIAPNGCRLVPPWAPTPLTVPATSISGHFMVFWPAVSGAWGYDLEVDTDAGFVNPQAIYSGALPAYSVRIKTDGTYHFRVRAQNGAGTSLWTTGDNPCVVTLATPLASGAVNVPASSNTGTYLVDWTPSVGADAYLVQEATDATFGHIRVNRTFTQTRWFISGRSNGAYFYRVKAVNSIGESDWKEGDTGCVVVLTEACVGLEAGPANPGPTREIPGAQEVPMLHLRFSAGQSDGILLQSITVDASGTGDDSLEIDQITLWRDSDGDGVATAADTLVGTAFFANDDGSALLDLSAEPVIAPGSRADYLLTCDFNPSAPPGGTYTLAVAHASGIQANGEGSGLPVSVVGEDVAGGEKTLTAGGAGSLQVFRGIHNPPGNSLVSPATDVPLLQFRFQASTLEDIQVLHIKFSSWGTGNEAAGVGAILMEDVDGDGTVSPGDILLGTPQVFSEDNGLVEFSSLGLVIPAGTSKTLLLVFNLAEVSGTFTVSLALPSDVEAKGDSSQLSVSLSGAPVIGEPMTFTYSPPADSGGGSCRPGGREPRNFIGWLLLLGVGFWVWLTGGRRLARKG